MSLPTDAKTRKEMPIARGVLDYFPDALAEVAHVSKVGNDQHNPGQPMHWAKEKSTDHADCIVRHLIDRGTLDTDGLRHSAKIAWRALALLQTEIEEEQKKNPLSIPLDSPIEAKEPPSGRRLSDLALKQEPPLNVLGEPVGPAPKPEVWKVVPDPSHPAVPDTLVRWDRAPVEEPGDDIGNRR